MSIQMTHTTKPCESGVPIKEYPDLLAILPEGQEYHVCWYSAMGEGKFKCEIRVPITTAEDARAWFDQHKKKAQITWRVKTTARVTGKGTLLKIYYRCQHNTLPRSKTADEKPNSKNTNCPAQMTLTVKATTMKKSSDHHLPALPMIVHIEHVHNHPITGNAKVMQHRDVSEDTIQKFKDLFARGHTPASALNMHKFNLHMEHPDNYIYLASDRSVCPDLSFVYKLYAKVFQKSYGADSGQGLLTAVNSLIENYNNEQKLKCASMELIKDKTVIAVYTPLMRRISEKHRASGELVFIDSTGGVDRYNCRVFLLLTHSAAGGLPLGCIITTSESTDALELGFDLYKRLLSKDSFNGRGERGPVVILTDDCEMERKALKTVFPESILILCVFHILQAVWRFLWDSKHAVPRDDRPHLLKLVRNLVYADNQQQLQDCYTVLRNDPVALQHSSFIEYVKRLYERQHVWAICHREQLPVRGNDTNNYVEAAMRILKDRIFQRVRAYSPAQLLDFLLTSLPAYYERRLIDVANGRLDMTLSKKYVPSKTNFTKDMITPLPNNIFQVHSGKACYLVDMSIEMCTCKLGKNGAPCKHQFAVVSHYSLEAQNFLPRTDEKMKSHMMYLATGKQNVPFTWFAPLRGSGQTQDLEDCLEEISDAEKENEPTQSFDSHPLHNDSADEFDNSVTSEELTTLKMRFHNFVASVEKQLNENTNEYAPAVEAFVSKWERIKTDTGRVSALHTFGKDHQCMPFSVIKRGGIKVQPTAVSRRQMPLGGRRCLQSGRPPKKHDTENKGLKRSNSEDGNMHMMPKRRPQRAPHNLSKCVLQNENIGKNHTSKW
ncbi:uncharacterized protein LOC112559914 isoform X2 [Pomacea canaliculata]|uniref:uncharacterized protein LOC112559914 isoform X2 n=1 Tax=Pomacea canaliculata TaxID=400727 RepID=UPI000D738CFC|nr:uncharacterized protein LOC112559914 isoform X2 [Pomacea canaliculata]